MYPNRRTILGILNCIFLMVFFILSSIGCSESTGPPAETEIAMEYNISGKVQKGPYIIWSDVTIQELNDKLEPKGNAYLTHTVDDKGQFYIETELKSNFVEIIGNGYYFDEISGQLSNSTLSLRSLSDLRNGDNINVNLLTTLTSERIRNLINGGMSFEDASQQVTTEIFAEFNIPELSDSALPFDKLDISNSSDADAVLLAISCIIQQVATNRPGTTTSQLSELLPKMAIDFGEDGQINDEALKQDIKTAGVTINLSNVRSNIEQRYAVIGDTIEAPIFESFIDSDGDTVVNGIDDDTPESFSFEFENINEVEIYTTHYSNEIVISGLHHQGNSPVTIDNGILIKNGSAVDGNSSLVANGDIIQVQFNSGVRFGVSTSINLTVGTETKSCTGSTRVPTLLYVQGYNQYYRGTARGGFIYFAVPIYPTGSYNVKYLGVGIHGVAESISLYNDGGDVPGTAIITSTTIGGYMPIEVEDLEGNVHTRHPHNQIYLGSNGIDLTANTKYWIVVKFSTSTEPKLFGLFAPVPFSEKKVSNDGVNWATWPDESGRTLPTHTVRIFLSN